MFQLQPEIRGDLMPIDRELNMFGVHVPDQAIIHGVGLNKVKIHITSKVQNSELQKF